MNESKRAKLVALLKRIEALETLSNAYHSKPNPEIYDSGQSFLLKGKRIEAVRDWRKRIKDAKMVRAAKNLTLSCDDDVKIAYTDFAERLKTKIADLNKSNLAPKQATMVRVVLDLFKTTRLAFSGVYDTYMSDIFNQGRMHQVVLNPRAELMKKFAVATFEETDASEAAFAPLKEVFLERFARLEGEVLRELQDNVTAGLNKTELTENLETYVLAHLDRFVKAVHDDLRAVYAAGNLYQLAKDKVELVRWQTGQHIDDCGHCRAIQMGDMVLTHNGKQLRHVRDDLNGGVSYYLSDILAIAKEKGAGCFNHMDCRCAFVAK